MAYSITQFENNLTNSLVALDNNFTTFGALVSIPCVISGTASALTLTPNSGGLVPTPTLSAYTTGMYFVGISIAQNLGPVTAQVGTLGVLNVYKDTQSGPATLVGNEIKANNMLGLFYDAALNSGAGGFHLVSSTAIANTLLLVSAIQMGNSQINNLASGSVSIAFTVAPGWSSQDQAFSITIGGAAAPAAGDFVLVNPPSVAGPGISYAGYVSAAGSSFATVNIRQINSASASLAPNSGIYRYAAIRMLP